MPLGVWAFIYEFILGAFGIDIGHAQWNLHITYFHQMSILNIYLIINCVVVERELCLIRSFIRLMMEVGEKRRTEKPRSQKAVCMDGLLNS